MAGVNPFLRPNLPGEDDDSEDEGPPELAPEGNWATNNCLSDPKPSPTPAGSVSMLRKVDCSRGRSGEVVGALQLGWRGAFLGISDFYFPTTLKPFPNSRKL